MTQQNGSETETEGAPQAPSFPPRIVAGLEPTSSIHLGHYVGAIQDLVRLQHEYPGDTFYIVADYHALARGVTGEVLKEQTLELVTTLLALGLDPNKTILYRQSDMPAGAELVWFVSCLIPNSELALKPPYSGVLESAEGPSAGSLLYPLLMAADVLCLRGTLVHVDREERLNAEIVRSIAGKLNRFFDWEAFPVPRIHYSQVRTVPGIDGKKMGSVEGNQIQIFEPFYSLRERVQAISDETSQPTREGEESTVSRLYSLVASPEDALEMAEQYRDGTIDDAAAKRSLIQALQEHFAESEERYHKFKNDPEFVHEVLREGARQARAEARYTLEILRDFLGLAA